MEEFGFSGYRSKHLDGPAELLAEEGARLRRLMGKRLQGYHAVWDLRNDEWDADRDQWDPDSPIVLDFGATRLELAAIREDLCVAWGSIDVDEAVPIGEGDPAQEWRQTGLAPIDAFVSQVVEEVAACEDDWGSFGICFRSRSGCFAVLGGGDELVLSDSLHGFEVRPLP